MERLKKIIATSVFSLLAIVSLAFGTERVAVSPDGKTIVTAGHNFALYIIDAESMEIKKRVRIESNLGYPEKMWYSADGKSIWYKTSFDVLQISTSTWKEIRKVDDASILAISPDHKFLVASGSGRDKVCKKIDANTGSTMLTFTVDGDERMEDFSIVDDNTLFVLFESHKTDSETKERIPYDKKKAMTVVQRVEAVNKSDGKAMNFAKIKMSNGSVISKGTTWYSKSYSPQIICNGSITYLLSTDGCVAINEKNETVILDIKDGTYKHYVLDKANGELIGVESEKLVSYNIASKTSKEHPYDGKFMQSPNDIIQMNDSFLIPMSNYRLTKTNKSGQSKTIDVL